MRVGRILCIGALVAAGRSGAQAAPIADWPLAAGARVRILSPALGDAQHIGNVASATWDTLVFVPVKQLTSTAIATPNIVRIEVAKGKHTQMGKGALIGFLMFGGAGAFMGNVTYHDCHPHCLWKTSRRRGQSCLPQKILPRCCRCGGTCQSNSCKACRLRSR